MSTLVTTNLKHGGAASPNMVLTSGGDVTFGGDVTLGTSVLAAPTGDAPSYTCRAWVHFDGTTNTGGFCTVKASGNVTSVADNGTGNHTVNFTTAMPDENYAVVCGSSSPTSNTSVDTWVNGYVFTTTSVRIEVESNASAAVDRTHVSVVIFR